MKAESINALRNVDIMNAFFDTVKSMRKASPYVLQDRVIEQAIRSGAPKFYTTFENARRFVSLLDRGKKLPLTNSNKIAMYKELHRRYVEEKNKLELQGYAILEQIIEEPAPSFYIDTNTFRAIIYKSLKRF